MKNYKIKIKDLADKKDLNTVQLKEYLETEGYTIVINNLPPTPPHIEYALDDLIKVWDILKNYL